jgi:RNA polymerase sigma-70 factor (sigma-E family)
LGYRGEAGVASARDEFSAFVATRQSRLQRMAWLLTGDWQLAEDLVQDALAKSWRHWRRVERADDVDAYVRRVIVNTFISSRRRRWRNERPAAEVDEQPATDGASAVLTRIVVADALTRLNKRQRTVVVLRFFEDMSVLEAARTLAWPIGTVKSTTSKALDQLRADARLGELVEEVW